MLAIFVAAAIAGVISLVPGGLGSFDLMVVVGLKYYDIADNQIVLILLFYRVFYYFVPFIVGLVFASQKRSSQTKNTFMQYKYSKVLKRFSFVPEYLIPNLSHWALAVLVFFSGILLLLSAATPGALERIRFAEEILSEPLLHLSHLLSVTAADFPASALKDHPVKSKKRLPAYLCCFTKWSDIYFFKGIGL